MPIAAADGRDHEVASVQKTAATALWSYRMAALGIALGDCFGERRQWFVGLGAGAPRESPCCHLRWSRVAGGVSFPDRVIVAYRLGQAFLPVRSNQPTECLS